MISRLLLLVFLSVDAFAQVNSGARFTAMANTGTAMNDVYSLLSNQAGIAKLTNSTLGLTFEDNVLAHDIKTQAIVGVLPTRFAIFGAYVHNYGIQEAYSDLKSGLTISKLFGQDFALAISVNYHQLHIPSYAKNTNFAVDFGLQFYFSEEWTLGAWLKSPGQKGYGNELTEKDETQVRVGNSYSFSNELMLSMEFRYFLEHGVDGALGMEFSIIEWLKLRGGLSLNHFQQYAGFGVDYKKFFFDAAVSSHPRLGYSPQIAVKYEF